MVWTVKHFRHYLYGHRCHVFSDHEPLKSLLNTPHPSGKLAQWGLALQEVDLTIHYRPGKSNVSGDTLSRFPVDQSDVCIEDSLVAAVMEEGDSSEGEKSELLPGVAVDLVGEEDCLDKGPAQAIIATI